MISQCFPSKAYGVSIGDLSALGFLMEYNQIISNYLIKPPSDSKEMDPLVAMVLIKTAPNWSNLIENG